MPNKPVFATRTGRPLRRERVYKIVGAAGKRAGVKDLHPHSFRHAHVSHALDNEAPPHQGADCKALSEELKAYEGVANRLRAKLAARERTKEIARHFADCHRRMDHAFEALSIPFGKKREMLTAPRVNALAHSNGTLKLQTNLGAIFAIRPEIKSSALARTGTGAGRRRRSGG